MTTESKSLQELVDEARSVWDDFVPEPLADG